MLEGWLATGAVDPAYLIILTPSEKPAAEAARARGARINPSPEALAEVGTVVLAVKPALWRAAATSLGELAADATVISVMAGVGAQALADAFDGRAVARVMPTTAVAQAQGVAAVWATNPAARAVAHGLFDPVADTVDLADEALIDAATAVAGSAPAFIYAFVEALARAGVAEGLAPEAAARLARGALRSAGAGAETGAPLTELVARIASPGGTTEAGLRAARSADLDGAAQAAVRAAVEKARSLGQT